MKNSVNIGIVVVLLLVLFTKPPALMKILHRYELKPVYLLLVILATLRETWLGLVSAVVFIILTENTHEGLVSGKDKEKGLLQAIKNDVGKSLIDNDTDDNDDKHDEKNNDKDEERNTVDKKKKKEE